MGKTLAVVESTKLGTEFNKLGPARLGSFLKDVRSEIKKVMTPSREEVQSTTVIVIATVFVFAAYFAVVDSVVGHSLDLVLKKLATR